MIGKFSPVQEACLRRIPRDGRPIAVGLIEDYAKALDKLRDWGIIKVLYPHGRILNPKEKIFKAAREMPLAVARELDLNRLAFTDTHMLVLMGLGMELGVWANVPLRTLETIGIITKTERRGYQLTEPYAKIGSNKALIRSWLRL